MELAEAETGVREKAERIRRAVNALIFTPFNLTVQR
jgi:hypothetical protein